MGTGRLVGATSTARFGLAAGAALASEINPNGALDIAIGGFVESLSLYGSLESKTDEGGGQYELYSDAEIDLDIVGQVPTAGLRYGAHIELAGATDEVLNTRKAYVFAEGGWGALRLGDDEGVTENMALGGFTVAVGTGGTDGDVIGTDATNYILSSDSTKIVYYSPEWAGFQLGLSFTPYQESFGSDIGSTDEGGLDDVSEGGLTYGGELGPLVVTASLVAAVGHDDRPVRGGRTGHGAYGGLLIDWSELELAAGVGMAEFSGTERRWLNVGAAYALEPLTVSINLGRVFDASDRTGAKRSEPWNLVLGAEVPLVPGLAAGFELSIFDDSRSEEDGASLDHGDSGVIGLTRLELTF